MIRYGIERFVGSWVSASGYRLHIRRLRKDQAIVEFLAPSGRPVDRPYMHDAPSVQMPARYDDHEGEFRVELWSAGKGFSLYLEHEYDYVLDQARREALVPGTRSEERRVGKE